MRFMDAVNAKYKIVAGDVISLDAYRQKLKQADQKVREKVQKTTVKPPRPKGLGLLVTGSNRLTRLSF